ncbi:MAG: amidohydrolase family protein [Acidobacteria bacterium]|nr:amidohydrolase family protein [Acidobacteriota bacterium]
MHTKLFTDHCLVCHGSVLLFQPSPNGKPVRRLINGLLLLLLLLPVFPAKAQTAADPALLAEINRIKAVDNHAHPKRVVAEGETDTDEEYAATPSPLDLPVRLRPDNHEYVAAWRGLYGYRHGDMSEAHLRELMAMKRRVKRERGDSYSTWVLDRLGIEVMLANRVTMGRGLAGPRFRWTPYADALMYPLDNTGMGRANPDYGARFAGSDRLLKRHLTELPLSGLPATLDAYLAQVVTPLLERWKAAGAVAVKFATAYHRPLNFEDVPESRAESVYARFVGGGEPPAADYKALQDFLFHYIAREAGRLGLVVHVHVGAGASGYFNQNGANPFTLEPALNDPDLRKTNFVLVHGGLPNAKATRALLYKPNVYADFSGQTFLTSTRELSEVLRSWLEFVPEKVLFGSDTFEITPEVGWEELGWLTTNSGRQALALALTGMMQDRQITRKRAVELARMVLRENAVKLYGLSR